MDLSDPLAGFRCAPGRAGLFLDFDGVLADIVTTHDGARPRPGVPDLLRELVADLGRVAVISGRPLSYLSEWLPEEVDLVGLYGLEWRTGGRRRTWPGAEGWRNAIATAVADAAGRFGPEAVEAKGLSLTVHYRSRGDDGQAMLVWAETHAAGSGLDVRPARKSIELHPPVDRDKGKALMELADELDPIAFMGDDVGDLPAFDALDQLARRGVQTVRIAVDSAEAPPELMGRADLVVDGPDGAEALLRGLIEDLRARPGEPPAR